VVVEVVVVVEEVVIAVVVAVVVVVVVVVVVLVSPSRRRRWPTGRPLCTGAGGGGLVEVKLTSVSAWCGVVLVVRLCV